MNKQKKETVKRLIEEGQTFTFENNRKRSSYDGTYYSEATDDLMSWIAKVENFISSNFNKNSGPSKMMESVDKKKFSGYYESEFKTELTKVKGAIKSCIELQSNSETQFDGIISLLKNVYFWTALVIISGGAYKLGYDNGNSKVYESTFELKNQIEQEKSEKKLLKKEVQNWKQKYLELENNNKLDSLNTSLIDFITK